MKKLLKCIFLVLAISSLALAACGGSGSGDAGDDGDDAGDDGGGGGGGSLSNADCGYTEGTSLWDGTSSGAYDGGAGTASTDTSALLVQPADLQYLGAFRLPDVGDRPNTFDYGGNAMTYYNDGGTATLFIAGHDRIVDDLETGDRIAQVAVPGTLVNSGTLSALGTAAILQEFADVSGEFFSDYLEIPRIGMAYVDGLDAYPEFNDKIYLSWGAHFHGEGGISAPSHAMFDPDLTAPDTQGAWYVGDRSLYATNGYMFEMDHDWADANLGGSYYLATGRFRDGGWSGQGPSLYVIAPWLDEAGAVPENCTQLHTIALLQYATSLEDAGFTAKINNYQNPDEWEGGAFLTTAGGKSAVIFAGTKATGDHFWYGWQNPDDPTRPYAQDPEEYGGVDCRNADDWTACDDSAMDIASAEFEAENAGRGWWSQSFEAQIIFYDPADLAAVAAGTMEPYEPQPYARLSLDSELLLPALTGDTLTYYGAGDQRKGRIGDIAFDSANHRLYVLELLADNAGGDYTRPVVHVWSVED